MTNRMYLYFRTGIPVLAFLLAYSMVRAEIPNDSVFNWQPVKEVKLLMKQEPRPVMIYLYDPEDDTSMLMLNKIFDKKELCMYVNPRFYLAKVNVRDSVIPWLNDKTYTRKSRDGYNPLVAEVLGDSPKFPSILFLNKANSGTVFEGYRSRYEMRCLLVYYAEDIVTSTPYTTWYKAYERAYPQVNLPPALTKPVKWVSLQEALALQKNEPRILFINWFAHLNAGSSAMLHNAFESPKVAEYLNKNFYCVNLDAQSKDTLYWDKAYMNLRKDVNVHQLAIEQLGGELKFPAFLFYAPGKKLIYKHQTYLSPIKFYALLNYVKSGSYKTQALPEYFRNFDPGK